MSALLSIEDLEVQYPGRTADRPVRAVDGVSFALERGETYALVGESGCGKSATALAVLRLVDPGRITGGQMVFDGVDLMQLSERRMRAIRGARIGMVFQESAAALNPVMKVGDQVSEALRVHNPKMSRADAHDEAVLLLGEVSLADPERQFHAYAHELSGGMKQRVMMAIALSCDPDLLIADEPTTALDVTIQAQILALLRRLRKERDLTVLLITHDMGVVAENADRVGVMYAGRLVEEALVGDLFYTPQHPYTQGLLRALPRAGGARSRRLPTLPGSVPDPADPPAGCRFHPRCPEAFDLCHAESPAESHPAKLRRVRCFLHQEPFKSHLAARKKKTPETTP